MLQEIQSKMQETLPKPPRLFMNDPIQKTFLTGNVLTATDSDSATDSDLEISGSTITCTMEIIMATQFDATLVPLNL